MPNYVRIRYYCDKSSAILDKLVDQFLLYLCAAEEGLDQKFDGMLADYAIVIEKMPENWQLWLKSQYIAFQLFRKEGLASKYLNHFRVRRRSDKELDFLKFQIEHPWRFVFCSIEQNPKDCFFEMKDVLTGEVFLLYSPGMADTVEEQGQVSLFFLLIAFNGECWQTYGSISYFKGIQPLDVLYFARQLKPGLVSMGDIPELIEKDPLPFMMLWVGGEYPFDFYKQDMIVIVSSDFKQEEFDAKIFNRDFIVKKIEEPPVYMLSLKRWQGMPHFSKCFYDVDRKILSLNAMTDRGYSKLVEALNKLGFEFPEEPENRATPAIISAVEEIFGKEIELNPYEKLFTEESLPDVKEELGMVNIFLEKLTDALNLGAEIDLQELAALSGIELEKAQEIVEQVRKKLNLK